MSSPLPAGFLSDWTPASASFRANKYIYVFTYKGDGIFPGQSGCHWMSCTRLDKGDTHQAGLGDQHGQGALGVLEALGPASKH